MTPGSTIRNSRPLVQLPWRRPAVDSSRRAAWWRLFRWSGACQGWNSNLVNLLLELEQLLHLLKGHAFRLRHHRLHPNELQNHHAAEKREYVTRRKRSDHQREKRRQQRRENPMRGAAQ